MKKLFLTAALLVLSACSTLAIQSPSQALFAGYGAYGLALATATDYAETEGANPAVVAKFTAANRKAEPARRFTRAYALCRREPSNSICAPFDFSQKSIKANALLLRQAVLILESH